MTKKLPIPLEAASAIIHIEDGQPWTDSRKIAEKFGKRHDNAMQAIRRMECSEGFRLLNFKESSYLNEQGNGSPRKKIRHQRKGINFKWSRMGLN